MFTESYPSQGEWARSRARSASISAVLFALAIALALFFASSAGAAPGQSVAVGEDGTILTSPDGVSWTPQTSGTTGQEFFGVAGDGSQWVVVGAPDTIVTSPDGVTWTPQTSGTTGQGFFGVAGNGSQWVAVGTSGTILTSPDGVTWTPQTSGTTELLFGVAWDGSQWVVTGLNGTILTSPDGVSWTPQNSGTTDCCLGVAGNGSQWVAVGGPDTIALSIDGFTWDPQTSGTSEVLVGVAWNGSQWVAVGDAGTILTSPDAFTWTPRTSGTAAGLAGVAWDGGQWLATGGDGTILTSPDGFTWTPQTSGTTDNLTGVAARPEQALLPVTITKRTVDTGVAGHWAWKMGKWTTSKLEQKATGPRPYSFRVLVDSHGFAITRSFVTSRITLTNPNDEEIRGGLNDVLPGARCELIIGGERKPLPRTVRIPAERTKSFTTICSLPGTVKGPVTNTATFTPADETGLDPVSDQATTRIDRTPPPNSPGQKVVLRDPMFHKGQKPLRYLDAVAGPWSITASYTVKLIPPTHPGKCWWHHNTAHLFDVKTAKKVTSSNRVSVYICRPKDAPKGTPPKDLPKVDKHGIPIVTPRLGGPKVIPPKYRTRLRTKVMAPRRVFRGQAFRVKVTTRNLTRKKAFGTIVKVKIPKGLRLASKQRGIRTKGRYAYWTTKVLRPKRKLTRTLRLVAIRPGAKRIVAISNARNAKRSTAKARVRVLRPRRDLS